MWKCGKDFLFNYRETCHKWVQCTLGCLEILIKPPLLSISELDYSLLEPTYVAERTSLVLSCFKNESLQSHVLYL